MVDDRPQEFHRRFYTSGDTAVDAKILEVLSDFPDNFDRELLTELITSAYRLGKDDASTIDLKIINSAVKELRYAFKIFQPYRHLPKVAMFGSARTSAEHPAYAMGREFGRLMVKANWMVITGAASGIMGAGNEGAGADGSFGLNIRLPFEQEANVVMAEDHKLINFKYFFTRKLLFLKESQATVLFPGGFGTLDEGFECLTLVQTGKAAPRPVVFVDLPDGHFWKPLLDFFESRFIAEGMISPTDRALYQVATSAQEAVDKVCGFYRVYHSMRYVDRRTVLRLNKRLPESFVNRLSAEFKDTVNSGEIVQTEALPEELESQGDEPELRPLSRLVLDFDRHSYGRLAEMIRRINSEG